MPQPPEPPDPAAPLPDITAPARVLLADDHAVLRAGLRLLIDAQPTLTVVGEASDGAEAVALTASLQPDLVVLDIGMPGMNGLEALRRIDQDHPTVKVLILTMHANEEYLFEVLQAGGSGYVLKQTADTELIGAIHAALRGSTFLYPSLESRVLRDYVFHAQRENRRHTHQRLTEREREVLQLVAEGLTNQEIADRLIISVKTVETHRAHIMTKLDLASRAELVQYALRHGYLTPDSESPLPDPAEG
ncbi:MAG: DNA-binding response regulator [Dehalococcoidia bacterium]|nr:DNA-binding response regulator [Dehalococcoidia bacterium]